MDKFTPGPWVVVEEEIRDLRGDGEPGIPLFRSDRNYRNWGRSHTLVEREANTRLVAAAPELLEALRGSLGALEMDVEAGVDNGDTEWEGMARARLQAARAAIAKATAIPSQEDATILSAEAKGGKLWL